MKPIKIDGLGPRYSHSTTVLKEDSYSQTVLILGGWNENNDRDNRALVFQMRNNSVYALLHYLDAAGIRWLLGVNQCQDLFELMFGDSY